MCKPIIKNGVCIACKLGKCKGCAYYFMQDLSNAGWEGIIINEKGEIKELKCQN